MTNGSQGRKPQTADFDFRDARRANQIADALVPLLGGPFTSDTLRRAAGLRKLGRTLVRDPTGIGPGSRAFFRSRPANLDVGEIVIETSPLPTGSGVLDLLEIDPRRVLIHEAGHGFEQMFPELRGQAERALAPHKTGIQIHGDIIGFQPAAEMFVSAFRFVRNRTPERQEEILKVLLKESESKTEVKAFAKFVRQIRKNLQSGSND